MNQEILKLKMSANIKLVMLFILNNCVYDNCNMRSAEIAKALGITRNNVLQALEDLQMLGYVSTTKDGYSRYRSTKITSKTKLILND